MTAVRVRRLVVSIAMLALATPAMAKPSPRPSPSPVVDALTRCVTTCEANRRQLRPEVMGLAPDCQRLCGLQAERRALEEKTARVCAALAKGEKKKPGGGPYVLTIEQTECPSRHPLDRQYVWMRTARSCDRYVWGGAGAKCGETTIVWSDWPEWGGLPAR